MRGSDTQHSAMFSYLSPEKRMPADHHPLRGIREVVDRALTALSPGFEKLYSTLGRHRTGEAFADISD